MKYAKELREAIEMVMWNSTDGVWYDYDSEEKTQRRRFYPSNVYPLIFGDSSKKVTKRVLAYLKRMDVLKYPGNSY